MDTPIDRRDFARQTSAVVGGLLSCNTFDRVLLAENNEQVDKRLILLGLNALAVSFKWRQLLPRAAKPARCCCFLVRIGYQEILLRR